ncbi:MAG: hypothetical protein NTX22_14100 [Ignavibacteriales bacterium]|nr:hypothetical protein [Ignavibacteriales bacterium]
MKFFFSKTSVLTFLLGVSIILLIINAILDRVIKTDNLTPQSPITVQYLNKEFDDLLLRFNLEKNWAIKKKIKGKYDSLSFVYSVKLPKDLPIALVLNEVNKKFYSLPVKLSSNEEKINKNTILKILYKNILMLKAEFLVDTTKSRRLINFAFILKDLDNLNKNEIDKLLITSEEFAIILVPTSTAEYIKEKAIENRKEYLILLNDDIDDQKYLLEEKFSKQRKLGSLREILLTFKEAKLFLYDENSNFYKSPIFGFLKKEFAKRKLSFIPLSKFHTLKAEGENEISLVLNSYLSKSWVNNTFIVSQKEFASLLPAVEEQRIKGNKLVLPSENKFGL